MVQTMWQTLAVALLLYAASSVLFIAEIACRKVAPSAGTIVVRVSQRRSSSQLWTGRTGIRRCSMTQAAATIGTSSPPISLG
jgi:hypothetical protein